MVARVPLTITFPLAVLSTHDHGERNTTTQHGHGTKHKDAYLCQSRVAQIRYQPFLDLGSDRWLGLIAEHVDGVMLFAFLTVADLIFYALASALLHICLRSHLL